VDLGRKKHGECFIASCGRRRAKGLAHSHYRLDGMCVGDAVSIRETIYADQSEPFHGSGRLGHDNSVCKSSLVLRKPHDPWIGEEEAS